jgi:HK97 family phage major capsid protein
LTYKEIQELRAKKAKLVADARALNEIAVEAGREFDGEEQKRWDTMMGDSLQIGDQIEREEKLLDAERAIEADGERRTEPDPIGEVREERTTENTDEKHLGFFRRFLSREISQQGYEVESRALQADSDVAGGYTLAPAQWTSQLIKAIDNMTFIRGMANVIAVTTSDSLGAPALDADPEDATWQSEIGTADEDTAMLFGARELKPSHYAKLLKVSNKLLRTSAIGVESLVMDRLSYKAGVTEEKTFLLGHGAGQPLGVMTADATGISTGRDVSTGNTNTTFTIDGLKEAKYSMKGQYWARLAWIFHRDAVKMAAKIKDGEGLYIWESSVRLGEPDRLLNFPVHMSEYQSNTFTSGLYVGILGDFSNYWIADLNAVSIQRLDELYAATHQTGYILSRYVDGMPVLEEAFARVTLT